MTEPIAVSLTGIDEIDRQHAQLVRCLNELVEFTGGSYEFAAVFTAINTLLDYARQHFSYEEELLASWHYPLLEKHIAEHRAIAENLQTLWARIEMGDEVIAEQLVTTIRKWILEHINAEDIEYVNFRKRTQAPQQNDGNNPDS